MVEGARKWCELVDQAYWWKAGKVGENRWKAVKGVIIGGTGLLEEGPGWSQGVDSCKKVWNGVIGVVSIRWRNERNWCGKY